MIRIMLAAAVLALGAAGCTTTGTAVEKKYVTVHVPVRAPCPDDAAYETVKAALPTPLREQERPATEEARHAAERAQLGRYEAPGGFADQAMAVIDDCRSRQPLVNPP